MIRPEYILRQISSEDLQGSVTKLAAKLKAENCLEGCAIVAIANGGLIPARMLSEGTGMPFLGAVKVQSYDKKGVRHPARLVKIDEAIAGYPASKVFVVDDIAGTGDTLRLIIESLGNIRVAVPYTYPAPTRAGRHDGSPLVNYYAEVVPEMSWLSFPWET